MRKKLKLKPKVELKCPYCFKVWQVYPSGANKKYCSRKCHYADTKGKTNTLKGRKFPERSSENHPNWKGEKASYSAAHHWAKYNFGQSMQCEHCKMVLEDTRQIQWANISGLYFRKREDWKRLCTPCHRKMDNHSEKMVKAWLRKKNI